MSTEINTVLINKLKILTDLSVTFSTVFKNFDEELKERKQILQNIQQTKTKTKKETITFQYSVKLDLITIFQNLVTLYIDTIILPLVEKIPDNKYFLQQVAFLHRANNRLLKSGFERITIDVLIEYIHKISKPLQCKIILNKIILKKNKKFKNLWNF